MHRFSAVVDLDAVRSNVAALRERAGDAAVLTVVKADGYGHGMVPCAEAALSAGASWLGGAFVEEALALRAAGIDAPVLAWLLAPADDPAPAVAARGALGVSAPWSLEAVARGGEAAGVAARVHLKVDTGLGRAGATGADWPALVGGGAKVEGGGVVGGAGGWA